MSFDFEDHTGRLRHFETTEEGKWSSKPISPEPQEQDMEPSEEES